MNAGQSPPMINGNPVALTDEQRIKQILELQAKVRTTG
jgi:hypothetical protein